MLSHTGTLWQYLGSFLIYTLATVGLIYGVYWYSSKAAAAKAPEAPAEETPPEPAPEALALESSLPLDGQKTLHVVRTGSERFLISTTDSATQLLSKLDPVPAPPPAVSEEQPAPEEVKVDLPWYAQRYAQQPARPVQLPPPVRRPSSFGERFIQSVQWLVSSRSR